MNDIMKLFVAEKGSKTLKRDAETGEVFEFHLFKDGSLTQRTLGDVEGMLLTGKRKFGRVTKKKSRPTEIPEGFSWCNRHDGGKGAMLPIDQFKTINDKPCLCCRGCNAKQMNCPSRKKKRRVKAEKLSVAV